MVWNSLSDVGAGQQIRQAEMASLSATLSRRTGTGDKETDRESNAACQNTYTTCLDNIGHKQAHLET